MVEKKEVDVSSMAMLIDVVESDGSRCRRLVASTSLALAERRTGAAEPGRMNAEDRGSSEF